MSETAVSFVLPPALTGRADLARLVREIEALDGELEAQKVRSRGQQVAYRLPNMSRALSDFLDLNKIDVSDDQGRMELVEQLRKLKDHAPVVPGSLHAPGNAPVYLDQRRLAAQFGRRCLYADP